MADLGSAVDIPNWVIILGTNALTGIFSFGVALSNRGPAMHATWNANLKTLIDGYDKRVSELTAEVHYLRTEIFSLRGKLDETSLELHEVRVKSGLGAKNG